LVSELSAALDGLLDLELEEMDEISAFKPTALEELEDYSKNGDEEVDREEGDDTMTSLSVRRPEDLQFESDDPRNATKSPIPIAAVDASSVTLGETSKGVMIAVRAAAVLPDRIEVFGPYFKHITESNKQALLNSLIDVFKLPHMPAPQLSKVADRVRSHIERLVQYYASVQVKDGIILWDGSMSVDKSRFDTPPELMKLLFDDATYSNDSIVGISKKTTLTLANGEKLLNLIPEFGGPFVADVSDRVIIPPMGTYRILGNVFAVKLSPNGFPFRADVHPAKGRKGSDVLFDLARSSSLFYGYPEPLRLAHIHSKLTRDEVIACQRFIVEKYEIPIVSVPDIHKMLLAPFG
jgi:hypothetical protein